MTMKKLVAATALIAGVTLGTASASFAQSIYYGGPYGYEYGYNGYDGYYGYRLSAGLDEGRPGPARSSR